MEDLILITGSSGLIGHATATQLLEKGYKVVGLDKEQPEDLKNENFKFFSCDLTKDDGVSAALHNVFATCGVPTSVIHLAAYYDFSGKDSPLYNSLTVEGTRRLLKGLRGKGVEQLIFSSTMLLLKPVSPGDPALTENSPLQAEWEYPKSKVKAEKVLSEEQGDIATVVHRIAGIYDDWCHSPPISQQISRIHQKDFESHFYPGRRDAGQPFIHLKDVVSALILTIEKRNVLGRNEIFLLGESDVMSYGELQDAIGNELYGKEWMTIRVPKFAAKAGAWIKDVFTEEDEFIQPWMVDIADAHYPMDNSKAKTVLQWSPEFKLREQISTMVAKLRESPKKWYEENGIEVPKFVQKSHSSHNTYREAHLK